MALSKVSTNQIDTAATPTVAEATVTGDLTVDTNTLKVDSTNNRLGVGVASPSQKLHVEGAGTQFLFLNNSTTNDGLYLKAGSGAVSLQTGGGGHTMNFFTSGTERLRILSGGGLTFNGDTATANALDDYEEGTWTPTDSSGDSLSLTIYSAKYTKIGNTVYVTIYGRYPTNSFSSAAYIGGLPFPGENTSNLYHILCAGYKTVSTLVAGLIFPNHSYFDFRNETGGQHTNAQLSGHDFIMSGVYQT